MRDYDPTTGRYLEPDPLGLVDGASVYAYVLQNPMRWVDPRGEFVGDFLDDIFTGSGRFFENYQKMRDANWKGSDKYFHCKANCEAARCEAGPYAVTSGFSTAAWMSALREATDIFRGKGVADSEADTEANATGGVGGLLYPEKSCSEVCDRYRPKGLPREY